MTADTNQANDYQDKANRWHKWNNQSSEYGLSHPEPPKPDTTPQEELRQEIYEITRLSVIGQYMRDENGDYHRMVDSYNIIKDGIADEMIELIERKVLEGKIAQVEEYHTGAWTIGEGRYYDKQKSALTTQLNQLEGRES